MSGKILGKKDQTSGVLVSETLVAIPAYNEEATIGSVVVGAKKHADQILVVDDGSYDRTAEIAREAGALVLQQERNGGKGAAVGRIFKYAQNEGIENLILLDGDWQHDPDEIPELLGRLESSQADIIVGSRYLNNESGETPTYRRVGQVVLDKLTHLGVGVHVSDSQSGYRAFNKRAIESLDVEHADFGVEVEMLRAASADGLSIDEVPISVRYDVPNPSTSNSVLHGIQVVDYLLSIVRDRHPLLFFGVPGLTLMLLGLLAGGWAVSIYQAGNGFHIGKALYGSVLFIIGTFSLYSALIMNMLGNRLEKIS